MKNMTHCRLEIICIRFKDEKVKFGIKKWFSGSGESAVDMNDLDDEVFMVRVYQKCITELISMIL